MKIGGPILLIILFFALFGPWMTSYSYHEMNLAAKNQPPSSHHFFGTDDLGRDLFARVWVGARISLLVGVSAACIDLIIGVIWGGIAAFSGGKIDAAMMRCADILYSLPYLLIVILLMILLGPNLFTIIIAMTVIGWITMARIVRGQILYLKEQEYVLAATALGASLPRILFKHLLPNAAGPIIVTLTLTIPSAIFTEAFLSFLGLGVKAPLPSWGTMVSEGLSALEYYPWRLFIPAGLISVTMLSFNLIGDSLHDFFQK